MDAPEWAHYAAVDKDGTVAIFEDTPHIVGNMWNCIGMEQGITTIDPIGINWKETVIKL